MAAKVLPPSSGGSFLDSPVFNHTRTKQAPMAIARHETSTPVPALTFDTSDIEGEVKTPYSIISQLNTPDSGFSAPASSTPIKTPESEFSSTVATPPSTGNGGRKRKTVTIDESQISVVVISPDDLFNTYSGSKGQNQQLDTTTSEELEPGSVHVYDPLAEDDDVLLRYHTDSVTGWPIKRSESLESRDNPFLPGGELSREAEDLLSRATIIRRNFYLNEDEQRKLREQQQRQNQSSKYVPITEQPEHYIHPSNNQLLHHSNNHYLQNSTTSKQLSSTPTFTEERIPLNSDISATESALLSASSNDSNPLLPKENGSYGDLHIKADSFKLDISEDESHMPGQGQTETVQPLDIGDLQVHECDKKQRKKCCSIM